MAFGRGNINFPGKTSKRWAKRTYGAESLKKPRELRIYELVDAYEARREYKKKIVEHLRRRKKGKKKN